MESRELNLDGVRFQQVDTYDLNTDEFFFDVGKVYACPTVLERYDRETLFRRIQAHAKRQVGEYNVWLMDEKEKDRIETAVETYGFFNGAPFDHEALGVLERSLPAELFDFVLDFLESDETNDLPVRRELYRHLERDEAARIAELLNYFKNRKNDDDFSGFDFWMEYIQEDKSLDSIENGTTIDSFFYDEMVIMTTPLRRATIVYMESSVKRIHEFYTLDRILIPG